MIKKEYKKDFPLIERKSIQKIKEMLNTKYYHLFIAYEEKIVGYILGYSENSDF